MVLVVHSSFIGRVTGDSKRSNGNQNARLGSRSETGGPPCLACQRSTSRRWPSARVAVPSSPMQASPSVPRTVLERAAAPRTHLVHCNHHAGVGWVRHQDCPSTKKQSNVPTCTLVTLWGVAICPSPEDSDWRYGHQGDFRVIHATKPHGHRTVMARCTTHRTVAPE